MKFKLRNAVNKEREEELEMLINRWEEESNSNQKKMEKLYNNKLSNLKSTSREVESKHSSLQLQYNDLEDKLLQTAAKLATKVPTNYFV
jgi:chromosome segregation ATPase